MFSRSKWLWETSLTLWVLFEISSNQTIITGLFGSSEVTLMNFLTPHICSIHSNSRNKLTNLVFSWDFQSRNRNSRVRIPTCLLCGICRDTLPRHATALLLLSHFTASRGVCLRSLPGVRIRYFLLQTNGWRKLFPKHIFSKCGGDQTNMQAIRLSAYSVSDIVPHLFRNVKLCNDFYKTKFKLFWCHIKN